MTKEQASQALIEIFEDTVIPTKTYLKVQALINEIFEEQKVTDEFVMGMFTKMQELHEGEQNGSTLLGEREQEDKQKESNRGERNED